MRPRLDYSLEIETVDGYRERWALDEALAEKRYLRADFATQLDAGFTDLRSAVRREITRDWPDLNLLDTVRVIEGDGTISYEGRHVANPRSTNPSPEIELQATGWSSAWSDRTFVEVLADAGPQAWGAPTLARRLTNALADWPMDSAYSASAEALALTFRGPKDQSVPNNSVAELMYTAPDGVKIAAFAYTRVSRNIGASMEAGTLFASDADDMGGADSYVLPSGTNVQELTTPRRYLMLRMKANATHTPANPASRHYSNVAVYGDNGLELIAVDGQPPGFLVSDALAYLLRYCPALTPGNITPTDWAAAHGAWHQPTTFAAAQAELNDTQLWHPAVWENRRYDYGPHDLSDFDWQVRTDDPGVRLSLQGDSTAELRNGICVAYDDVADGPRFLTPDTHEELRDPSPDNPANRAGIPMWGDEPLTLDYPTNEPQALRVGGAYLAELQRPKAAGSIEVASHIRDRAGNWQPASRVRAGETIAITDHPNDAPRLITETRFDLKTHAASITVERPSRRIEALLSARVGVRRGAKGLR